jgi:hypothetical protein
MSDSIFEVEYRPGEEIVLRFKSPRLQRLPDSTRQHLRVARKEILLALRTLLEGSEGATRPEKGKSRKRAKVEVQ